MFCANVRCSFSLGEMARRSPGMYGLITPSNVTSLSSLIFFMGDRSTECDFEIAEAIDSKRAARMHHDRGGRRLDHRWSDNAVAWPQMRAVKNRRLLLSPKIGPVNRPWRALGPPADRRGELACRLELWPRRLRAGAHTERHDLQRGATERGALAIEAFVALIEALGQRALVAFADLVSR